MSHANTGRVVIKITNSLNVSRILMLEPWTGEYDLPPGKTLDVVAEGDLRLPLEIEITDERVIIYGFDSSYSLLTAFDGATELKSYPKRPSASE
jgi:hypothetical protein